MKGGAIGWTPLLLWLFLVSTGGGFAESERVSPQIGRVDREIQTIEAQIEAIAGDSKLFTRGKESGVITLYPPIGNKIKLVVQFVSDASGQVSEYYYQGNSLFYAVDACRSFESTGSPTTADDCRTISEDRFYFSDGKLVHWLSGEGSGPIRLTPVTVDTQELSSVGSSLADRARLWLAFARSPVGDFGEFRSQTESSR